MMKENTPPETALERLKSQKDECQLGTELIKRIQSDLSKLSGATRRAGLAPDLLARVKAVQALCKELEPLLEVERKRTFYAWVEKRP